MPDTEGGGVITMVGVLIAGVIQSAAKSRVRRAERRARAAAVQREQQAQLQRQKWFALMQQQKARGFAGDASADQATSALRGIGGLTSKEDEEFF